MKQDEKKVMAIMNRADRTQKQSGGMDNAEQIRLILPLLHELEKVGTDFAICAIPFLMLNQTIGWLKENGATIPEIGLKWDDL